ncbi:hypothetical protein BKA70DRAFT_1411987 [Coprinopsis sp. MPI-PUGE-AT-0042]|nr:hypothetical protein BKA70DRAFT_1411987 [Coprinopsis sp. MPI-PUGE-AT-0042]
MISQAMLISAPHFQNDYLDDFIQPNQAAPNTDEFDLSQFTYLGDDAQSEWPATNPDVVQISQSLDATHSYELTGLSNVENICDLDAPSAFPSHNADLAQSLLNNTNLSNVDAEQFGDLQQSFIGVSASSTTNNFLYLPSNDTGATTYIDTPTTRDLVAFESSLDVGNIVLNRQKEQLTPSTLEELQGFDAALPYNPAGFINSMSGPDLCFDAIPSHEPYSTESYSNSSSFFDYVGQPNNLYQPFPYDAVPVAAPSACHSPPLPVPSYAPIAQSISPTPEARFDYGPADMFAFNPDSIPDSEGIPPRDQRNLSHVPTLDGAENWAFDSPPLQQQGNEVDQYGIYLRPGNDLGLVDLPSGTTALSACDLLEPTPRYPPSHIEPSSIWQDLDPSFAYQDANTYENHHPSTGYTYTAGHQAYLQTTASSSAAPLNWNPEELSLFTQQNYEAHRQAARQTRYESDGGYSSEKEQAGSSKQKRKRGVSKGKKGSGKGKERATEECHDVSEDEDEGNTPAKGKAAKPSKPWPTDDHIDEEIDERDVRVFYRPEVVYKPKIHSTIQCRWVTKGNPRDGTHTLCMEAIIYERNGTETQLANAIKNHIASIHLLSNRTSRYYHGGLADGDGELIQTTLDGTSEINCRWLCSTDERKVSSRAELQSQKRLVDPNYTVPVGEHKCLESRTSDKATLQLSKLGKHILRSLHVVPEMQRQHCPKCKQVFADRNGSTQVSYDRHQLSCSGMPGTKRRGAGKGGDDGRV